MKLTLTGTEIVLPKLSPQGMDDERYYESPPFPV